MPQQCYTHMSIEERETLSLGLAQGYSLRAMATVLGRTPSTVSRELARNAGQDRPYRACAAQHLAAARARQPRRPRKLLDPWLWQYVRTHLGRGCSPQQIAGRLRRAYPDDMQKHLSTETLDAGLYVLPRGTLRSELLATLRPARKARRPQARGTDRRGHIPNMTPIAERLGCGPPRGTDDAPGHAGPHGGHGCRQGPRGIHQETPARAGPAAQDAALRLRQREGGTRAPGPAARHSGVLCGSAQPLATRDQREHQWPAASGSAQGHGAVGLYAARAERHRASAEYAPKKVPHLRHAAGGVYTAASSFTRCTGNLKPPSI